MEDFLNGNGKPCMNCESYAATDEFVHFCSAECMDEYNGEGEFAEDE